MENRSDSNTSAFYCNPSFLNDDSQPPPYSSIYPLSISQTLANYESKTSGTSSTVVHTDQISTNIVNTDLNPNSACVNSSNLFQNASEPISYDQLFLNSASTYSSAPSTRFLFQSRTDLQPNGMQDRLRKEFKKQMHRSYLLRHTIFIILSSLSLISFQIILMNNKSVLSHLASGLWCGFVNLLTLLLSLLTSKLITVNLIIKVYLINIDFSDFSEKYFFE